MSKLYKKVKLLVSRGYWQASDGLRRGELQFARSMEEYDSLAKKNGWDDEKSAKASWCVKPIEVTALVLAKDYAKFMQGQYLPPEQVFFAGNDLTLVHNI